MKKIYKGFILLITVFVTYLSSFVSVYAASYYLPTSIKMTFYEYYDGKVESEKEVDIFEWDNKNRIKKYYEKGRRNDYDSVTFSYKYHSNGKVKTVSRSLGKISANPFYTFDTKGRMQIVTLNGHLGHDRRSARDRIPGHRKTQ